MSLAPYPVQPVTDDVVATAARFPDKVALICGATGARYTYAELVTAARRLGRVLQDEGVGVGDRVRCNSLVRPFSVGCFIDYVPLEAVRA